MPFLLLLPIAMIMLAFAGLYAVVTACSALYKSIRDDINNKDNDQVKLDIESNIFVFVYRRIFYKRMWVYLGRFFVSSYGVGAIVTILFYIVGDYEKKSSGVEIIAWLFSPISFAISPFLFNINRLDTDLLLCNMRFGCFESPYFYALQFVFSIILAFAWTKLSERSKLLKKHD